MARNQISLRPNKKANIDSSRKPKRVSWGAIPYGYYFLDGALVTDSREIKVVRKILDLHQKGKSFNAIAISLNDQKLPSKHNKKWSDKTLASVIRRHKQ